MLLQRVRHFVRQHALFRSETRVVVALSGGSDSVALALLLRELEAAGEVRLAGIAHLNHQLREHAERDERFSASVAQSLTLPFIAESEDVRARACRDRRSTEDAGRRARYEFFERARVQFGADLIALGHTRDDQAETFLLRLLRGAGPRGLASIHPRHGRIVRPLLDCGRAELREYLDYRQQKYVHDETNEDVSIPRNRVRAELVPLLKERFNPAIVDVLAHEAELMRELWAWLEDEAGRLSGAAGGDASSARLDVARLQAATPAVRRLVLWRAMDAAAGGRPVGFSHVEAALRLLDVAKGGIDAPGHRVQRIGGNLVLTGGGADSTSRGSVFAYPLSVPGEVRLAEAGCVIAAELQTSTEIRENGGRSGSETLARVRRDLCGAPLVVRNRRPGDRFRPVGLGGRKKLQDYFVDRKVALDRRDLVPLVVDAADRIVWVAGYAIDEAFRVTDPSQSVLLLRLRQV